MALTGLTYSYDSAGAASLRPGTVNITNWATFSEHDAVSRSIVSTSESERYSAHSYGLFSVLFKYQTLTKPGESDPNTPLDRPIEIAPDRSWVYYMREYNPTPEDTHTNLAHKSDRYVGASGNCTYYPLTEGQYGNSSTVAYMNGTVRHQLDGISVCASSYMSMFTNFMLMLPRIMGQRQLPGSILAPISPKMLHGDVGHDAPLSLPSNF